MYFDDQKEIQRNHLMHCPNDRNNVYWNEVIDMPISDELKLKILKEVYKNTLVHYEQLVRQQEDAEADDALKDL